MKRKSKIKIKWSPSFAYILGIIATDGNLSPDERHITITSKDKSLLHNIKQSLNLKNKIGIRINDISKEKRYFVLQVGDKNFYKFLISIGITSNKSKTLGKLKIQEKYFSHFLRGCIDGDGNIDISMHPESKQKQLRIRLASASPIFLKWVHNTLKKEVNISGGWIYSPKKKSWQVLSYGKKDSIKILYFMYSAKSYLYLKRKFNTAKQFLK